MITVTYHSDLKEVQSDPHLAALLGEGARSAPFDRLAWLQGLEVHCGLAPLLAVARDGPHRAVLALTARDGRLEALANWYSFWTRPMVSPGANADALLAALAADLAKRSGRLSLHGLPGEDGSVERLARAFRRSGWLAFSVACGRNHILNLNGRGYAEYLAARPGPLRTTLKRKAAKVACTIHTRFDAEAWAAYEAIYAESWKPEEGSPAFLRAFAETEGAAGRLRLGVAHVRDEADGEAVAAQFWTVEAAPPSSTSSPTARRPSRCLRAPASAPRCSSMSSTATGSKLSTSAPATTATSATGWRRSGCAIGSTCSDPRGRRTGRRWPSGHSAALLQA